ncbi:hypothetical protein TEA_010300 [Camellia sinensis var. sinensis]|uniref:Uncharacterized protein n=1 Tax=Camellia sinensis var. sinensis TaxID=542762 RepID=A0A4S4D909_CAMSN|nr:hypothetical protein TEA_010300 [Camellia sinensis var. sinensis]
MEAALIVFKRMLADYYVKSSSEKEDSRKVLTREPYETHFGKSNVRQTLELEGSGLATRKVVQDASWFGPIKEEQHTKIGKVIVVLAHGAMCYVMFCSFKELIKDKDYNTVGESEDFEKIFDQSVVEDEYSKLCEILDSCKCDPLVAIAEGKVKVDQFSTLREHDLCDTIRKGEIEVGAVEGSDAKGEMVGGLLVGSYGFERLGGLGLGFWFEWNDISPNEVAIALEMLRNYEPLKEDCKMQLTLELTNEKSYCILDSLVLEALGGVDIELLRNCLPKTADDVFLVEDVTFACSVLADGLFIGLYELAAMKTSAVSPSLCSFPPPPFT